MKRIKVWIKDNPLCFVLLLALFVRLIAVFFAKGYMMFDDHYLIVEPAGGWANGVDVNNWLPNTEGNNGPHFMSFFYVGIVWVFFEILNWVGIEDATTQMFLLRLVHALYSVLIVYYAYKITEKLGSKKDALLVGLLLALLAYFPNFSVKQLIEMVCIPPLLASFYYLLKSENKSFKYLLYSGILAGIAVGIRYQTGLMFVGVGAVLLFYKKWKSLTIISVSAGIIFFLTQISDLIIWHEPFAQLKAYIGHNTSNSGNYVTSPWYNYILTLIAFLIPPVSLMLIFGFFKNWKSHLLFIVPVLLFLVFHSIYPNKQERFILPIVPFIIMIGVIGWNQFKQESKFWNKNKKLHTGIWTFFWTVNIATLLVFSTAYTKKQYIESMVYLSERDDITTFLLENTNVDGHTMVPMYYYNSWDYQFVLNKQHKAKWLQENIIKDAEHPYPNYVMFYGDLNLESRRTEVENSFGKLELLRIVEPGSLDKILHFINPHNKIERVHIYKIVEFPEGVLVDED